MVKAYRKTVSRRRRVNRDHGGVPQLAAQLCGCDLSMAYKVRNGQATSAKVSKALAEAERQLQRQKDGRNEQFRR